MKALKVTGLLLNSLIVPGLYWAMTPAAMNCWTMYCTPSSMSPGVATPRSSRHTTARMSSPYSMNSSA
jgi:hypothetical protein